MSVNPAQEAITMMLDVEDETERCLAIGELMERLLRASGNRQDGFAAITAAVLLMWRGDHSGEKHFEQARQRALTALRAFEFDVDALTALATVGRGLTASAVELQGEQLLAGENAEPEGYVPEEGDLAIWRGQHIVRVRTVEVNEVHDGTGLIGSFVAVLVLTAGRQNRTVPLKELALYHRAGKPPAGDHMLVSGD
jgi:hypothetical protein